MVPVLYLAPVLDGGWVLERDEVSLNHLMVENRFTRLGAARCGASGKRRNDADGPIFPTPIETIVLMALMKGPGDFALWRRWLALVVRLHHGVQPAWPATKIATVK